MSENDRVRAMRRLGREELERLTPRQALDRVITQALFSNRRPKRPGKLVENAGEATRQALAELTPADVMNVRTDEVRAVMPVKSETERLQERLRRRW